MKYNIPMSAQVATLYSVFKKATRLIGEMDSRYLLNHVVSNATTMMYTQPDTPMTDLALREFDDLVQRRLAGEPVAYLTGERGFWSLDLQVTPATLIPRTETELLIEIGLEKVEGQSSPAIIDLGTGSGAIALTLAKELPHARIHAVDVSHDTLEVARQNAVRNGITNVSFLQSHWFENMKAFDANLIITNPPYIADSDPHLSEGDLRFEPRVALVSGHDGLDAIRLIIQQSPDHMLSAAWLVIEHGYDQAARIRELLSLRGFAHVETRKDLEQRDRVTFGQWLK